MVFVGTVLILATAIVLFFSFFILFYFRNHPTTVKGALRRFFFAYKNVLTLYVLLFVIALPYKHSWVAAIILFVVATYFQEDVWSTWMEEQIVQLRGEIRKETIAQVLKDNLIITHKTIHKYLYAIARSEAQGFKEVYEDTINMAKMVMGTYEAPKPKDSKFWKDNYEKQKKFFKYKVVNFDEISNPYDTWEKLWDAATRAKKNRDPRVKFNALSRLPWKLNFDNEPDLFFPLFARHTLVLYNFFKTTMVAVFLMFVYFIYTIFFFKIQFLKQLSVWFVIGMLFFWLMSGFNFFVKRYQYGKFTSQIQRFWKRTNTSFWLIEGFLILLFFYYYLNSSQEPLYMYDYSAINQEFLVSLQTIGINVVLLSLIIYFMYFTLLRINSNSWTQLNVYLLLISVFIFFSFFIETYQFYYLISTFNERVWVLNEEEGLWGIETDNPILRTKHQYLFVCLIAKYWHFLFIFLSWVFFLIKSFERRKVTFVLFGANLQNMIILYVLNFACYIQWFKWLYRRFFDLPYTWFFANVDNKFIFRLFFEIKLLFMNLISFNSNVVTLHSVIYKSLSLWNVDSLCMWKFV